MPDAIEELSDRTSIHYLLGSPANAWVLAHTDAGHNGRVAGTISTLNEAATAIAGIAAETLPVTAVLNAADVIQIAAGPAFITHDPYHRRRNATPARWRDQNVTARGTGYGDQAGQDAILLRPGDVRPVAPVRLGILGQGRPTERRSSKIWTEQ